MSLQNGRTRQKPGGGVPCQVPDSPCCDEEAEERSSTGSLSREAVPKEAPGSLANGTFILVPRFFSFSSLLVGCSHLIRRRYQRVPGRKTRIIESIVSLTLLPRPVQLTIKSLSPVHHHRGIVTNHQPFSPHPPPRLLPSPRRSSGHFSFDVERSIIPLIPTSPCIHPSRRIFNYLNAEQRCGSDVKGTRGPAKVRGGPRLQPSTR